MPRDDVFPTSITGTIKLSDGSENQFSIEPSLGEHGWQQWGNTEDKLYCTVDVLDAITEAAGEHLHEEEEA